MLIIISIHSPVLTKTTAKAHPIPFRRTQAFHFCRAIPYTFVAEANITAAFSPRAEKRTSR